MLESVIIEYLSDIMGLLQDIKYELRKLNNKAEGGNES